jgi:hypothetical protein
MLTPMKATKLIMVHSQSATESVLTKAYREAE